MAFQFKSWQQIVYSMASWTKARAIGLNDFSIGSKIRTIYESVALELQDLYYFTYTSLFTAQEEAVYSVFDFPRLPAQKSTGVQTFYVDNNDGLTRTIPIGALVSTAGNENVSPVTFETTASATLNPNTVIEEGIKYENGRNTYFMTERRVYEIESIFGDYNTSYVEFTQGTDYVLVPSSGNIPAYIHWQSNQEPNYNSTYYVRYKTLSVDVPVRSLEPGLRGNVRALTINKVAGSVSDFDGTVNHEDFTTGSALESDASRKVRFASFINGLARGTIDSLRFAALNKTETYKVDSVAILDQEPTAGFAKMYVADSSGAASEEMLEEVRSVVEGYRGAGLTVTVDSATRVYIDVACRLRIRDGYNKEIIRDRVRREIISFLSKFKFNDDGEPSTVYLSALNYVISNVRTDAIIEADISFKRHVAGDEDVDSGSHFPNLPFLTANREIEDLEPALGVVDETAIAEIFRPGSVEVSMWYQEFGSPSERVGLDGDYYKDLSTDNYYVKELGVWNPENNV